MKKLIILFLILIIALCVSCNTSQYRYLEVSLPDITNKPDGTYRGEQDFKGTPIKVTLDVTLQNQIIESINIIWHACSPIGKRAEKIIENIITSQSLDVDIVSGATVSSKAILKAVENALQ